MKRTKLILSFIALILTILVFVQACKKENRTDLSGTYEIGLQQTKKITTNNSITAIKLTNINDSRCPINANCVTEGYVFINLNFSNKNGEQNIELCSANCLDKRFRPNTITINKVTYQATLKDVTPFPDITNLASTNKKATIIVTKK